MVEAVQKGVDERLKLYPDPDASKLVSALAQSYGVKESQVFVGNGSDEVLAFAFQAFFEEGGTVLFPDITYSFYPVYCNMLGIHYRTVPLQDDFTIPVEKMLGDNDGVVITNPNAPTGIELDQTCPAAHFGGKSGCGGHRGRSLYRLRRHLCPAPAATSTPTCW